MRRTKLMNRMKTIKKRRTKRKMKYSRLMGGINQFECPCTENHLVFIISFTLSAERVHSHWVWPWNVVRTNKVVWWGICKNLFFFHLRSASFFFSFSISADISFCINFVIIPFCFQLVVIIFCLTIHFISFFFISFEIYSLVFFFVFFILWLFQMESKQGFWIKEIAHLRWFSSSSVFLCWILILFN